VRITTTIGRVDFLVDFDGRKLPARARQIGEGAGDAAGTAATKRFAEKFTPFGRGVLARMSADGKLAGFRISDAMEVAIESRLSGLAAKVADAFLTPEGLDNFSRNFDRVDDAAKDLRLSLQELSDSGNLNNETWGRFGGTLNQWLGKAREAESQLDELTAASETNRREIERGTKSNDGYGSAWKRLSFNVRQALIITAAIAAGGEQIAVLGSALGAGLTTLALSLAPAVTGLGFVAAAIASVSEKTGNLKDQNELLAKSLTETLSEAEQKQLANLQALTAAYPNYVRAISGLPAAFSKASEGIERGFFTPLTVGLESIPAALEALAPQFDSFSAALGNAFAGLLTDLTGPEGIAKISELFDGFKDQIGPIVQTIGNIGAAVANILIIAQPFVQNFVEYIDEVTSDFKDFTESVGGQNAIAEWFSNGERVLRKFGDLVGDIGKGLAGLVDEDSVKRTEDFLENLSGATPFLFKILDVLGELDAFGLIAQVLNDLGNAIVPILDLLDPLFSILNTLSTAGLKPLTAELELIGILLTPFKFLLELVSIAVERATEYFAPFAESMEKIFVLVQEALDGAFAALAPAIEDLADTILDLLPSPQELARIIEQEVIPAIDQFARWLIEVAVPATEAMIKKLAEFIEDFDFAKAMKDFDTFVTLVQFTAGVFVSAFSGPIGAVQRLIDLINLLNGTNVRVPSGLGGGGGGGTRTQFNAAGTIATRATYGVYGEAGPEAIVPLDRPLDRVDPRVRALSAIAQGKQPPPTNGGDGRGLLVESGAIQINGVSDGRMAASAALDRLVTMTGG